MGPANTIEVVDPNGWRKEYHLEKTIVFIGSDPGNDIPLESGRGSGVSPRHLQLICMPDTGCRLVNLGDNEILLGETGEERVAPRLSVALGDNTQIRLGEFLLRFHLGEPASNGAAARQQREENIGLTLTLPQTRLAPNRSVEGVVRVSNLGDRTGVQFDLDLEGLDDDCFDLEPGPLLSSGAEKEVLFRLHHRGHKPRAGQITLTIRATAGRAYPGEEAAVTQMITVLPYYHHQVKVTPPPEVQALLEKDQSPPKQAVASSDSKAEPAGSKMAVKKKEAEIQVDVTEPGPPERSTSLKMKETEMEAAVSSDEASDTNKEAAPKKPWLSNLFQRSQPEVADKAGQPSADAVEEMQPPPESEPKQTVVSVSPPPVESEEAGPREIRPPAEGVENGEVAAETNEQPHVIQVEPVEADPHPPEPAAVVSQPPAAGEDEIEVQPPAAAVESPAVEADAQPEEPAAEATAEEPVEPAVIKESAPSAEAERADEPVHFPGEEEPQGTASEPTGLWAEPVEPTTRPDWWGRSAGTDPDSEKEEKQVLKLKARRPPAPAEPAEEPDLSRSSPAEDWWSVPATTSEPEEETETETGSSSRSRSQSKANADET